ncbi:MAG TPA: hypothetical protein PLY56_15295 [Armatimonadota bacterium]|nr:hypothetical protein [Armatimonadota bacterium]HOM80180.1 hypothetical protein [Armatimonadota bacterium]
MEWTAFKAIRAPYSREVWELTLEELAACPLCSGTTFLIPFPAGGASAAGLEGASPHELPPLDAAIFLCFNEDCLSIYVIIFSEERREEFEALIPYLREAGRRALGDA